MPFAVQTKLRQQQPLEALTQLTKALADETRLRILALLQKQELCACQIVEVFALANSTISKHLAILKQAGLIQSRKNGRWIFFFLPPEPLPEIAATYSWLQQLWQADPSLEADQAKITEILKIDPVELCKAQNTKNCC